MRKLFTLLLAVAASVGTMFAWDYERVQIGDLYYNLDAANQTAQVTSQNSSYPFWSTTITTAIIPASVEYNSVTYTVTSIGGAFAYCSGLTSVTIGNSVTSIGEYAFYYCTGLTSVTIPNSVTSIGRWAFDGCTGLTSIDVASDNSNYCSVDGVLFNKDKTTLIRYPGGKQGAYTIPNSVTSIGNYAFNECYGLTSVTIPNSVTSIGDFAFEGCTSLTSVTIGNSVTSIGESAFSNCTGLTSITIPNSVTSIGYNAFHRCTGLTSVTIGNSVTRIGSGAFAYCTGLTSVNIPNSVTTIEYYAFSGCTGLTSPVYNAHVFAFMPTSYSGAYTIPDGIESIAGGAFSNCTGLTSVTIPNSVTSTGRWAFEGCTSLTSITCEAITPPTLDYDVFKYVDKSIPLYVPAESIAAYQAADVWKEFGNILAIDDSTEEVNYATLADIYNMAADSTFTLGAFDVMYVPDFQSGSNMYIKDSTGSCVIYKVNYGLQAGDHVEAGLQGKVSIYNGLHEVIPITAKEELTITHGEAPAPMVATEVPSLNNASQYVVYEGVSFTTDTAFVEGRRHMVYGTWNGQTITFYNQYHIGATLSANKTYNITAVNTIYRTTPQAYPLAVEEMSPAPCIIASGTCGVEGDNLAWTLSCDSVLTISGTGRMANYVLTNSKSPAPWYTYHTAIKSVVIEDGVTSIGKNAFSECDMISIMIAGSVSFIADYAFSSCKKIISVDVAIDNQNYCSDDGILFNKNKTKLILYPAAKSETSYSIPDSVTHIGAASFEYCDNLSNINIPNSVINIGRIAFYGSSALTSIAIPNSVTSIEEGAFIDCRGLTSVTIGNSVTSIVSSAFSGCTGLTSIINYASTPQTITASVFNNVNKSTCTLYVPAESLAAYQAADVWKNFGNILPIGDDPAPCIIASGTCGAQGDNLTWMLSCDSVLTISGTGAMADYNINNPAPWYSYVLSVKTVVVNEGVPSIGMCAFMDCSGLTSITIPNSVKSIGDGAFSGCSGLTSIEIPDSVTSIGVNAFCACYSLASIEIPNSVTSIGFGAFQVCYGLTSVTIPNSVTSIGEYAFGACYSLASIVIPNSVTYIAPGAFAYCTSLNSINVANDNTNYISIEGVLFAIKTKTILKQYPAGKRGAYTIPNNVTSIGSRAFEGSSGLTSVIIPNGVTNIGTRAFYGCSSLTSVTNYATTPQQIESDVFGGTSELDFVDKSACTLYVPAQSLAAYQAADVWKEFGTILTIEGDLPIEPTEGEFNVLYIGHDGDSISSEEVTLHLPVAPVIEGFLFVGWQTVSAMLTEGIIIQAVYQAEEPTSAPAVYTNPANPAQKLIRNGNVYILHGDKVYTVTGQTVK